MSEAVKMPHIRLEGEIGTLEKIIGLIKSNFDVTIVVKTHDGKDNETDDDNEFVDIRKTDYWKKVTPGSILAGTRLKHNLTQKQLAKLAGMSYSTISAFESGKRPLTMRAATRLANVMDEDPNDFFDFIGESKMTDAELNRKWRNGPSSACATIEKTSGGIG